MFCGFVSSHFCRRRDENDEFHPLRFPLSLSVAGNVISISSLQSRLPSQMSHVSHASFTLSILLSVLLFLQRLLVTFTNATLLTRLSPYFRCQRSAVFPVGRPKSDGWYRPVVWLGPSDQVRLICLLPNSYQADTATDR